jgi:hypothetical protein
VIEHTSVSDNLAHLRNWVSVRILPVCMRLRRFVLSAKSCVSIPSSPLYMADVETRKLTRHHVELRDEHDKLWTQSFSARSSPTLRRRWMQHGESVPVHCHKASNIPTSHRLAGDDTVSMVEHIT